MLSTPGPDYVGIRAMNLDEYQKLAMSTSVAHSEQLVLYKNASVILNAALGLTGEAGEFADLVKKGIFHGHGLDRDKLLKEAGDILWYLAQAATGLGVSLSEIAILNIDKLRKRYPEGFSVERSNHNGE